MRRPALPLIFACVALYAPTRANASINPSAPACDRVAATALKVGWPATELGNLRRIAARESSCNPLALNPLDPTIYGSRGTMQINGSNVRWLVTRGIIRNADDLYNPVRNLRAALALWREYGWRPWSGKSHTP